MSYNSCQKVRKCGLRNLQTVPSHPSPHTSWCSTTFSIPQWVHKMLLLSCCPVTTACALKKNACNHLIEWQYDMRDCLRQIGVLWSDVPLAVWQIRQRHTRHGSHVEQRTLWDMQINHCCQFPREMRFLGFRVDNYWVSQWHVFQGHIVYFAVL